VEHDGFKLSSLLDIVGKFGQFLRGEVPGREKQGVSFENITHRNVGGPLYLSGIGAWSEKPPTCWPAFAPLSGDRALRHENNVS
jgi:hypothetical protein